MAANPPSNPIATFEIEYRDGRGRMSKRVIDIPSFDYVSAVWIDAYCRMREEYRSFYPERMASCVAVDTGEAVPDVMAYLKNLYFSTTGQTGVPVIQSPGMAEYLREVRGFVAGITVDGLLTDVELRALRQLFARCPEDTPPDINKVLDTLEMAQEDGVITHDEHKQILNAVQKLTKGE